MMKVILQICQQIGCKFENGFYAIPTFLQHWHIRDSIPRSVVAKEIYEKKTEVLTHFFHHSWRKHALFRLRKGIR